MHKSIIASIAFMLPVLTFSQAFDSRYPTDTIHLNGPGEKKIVSYYVNKVLIYIPYNDYKKSLTMQWKDYKRSVRRNKYTEVDNPAFWRRFLLIDSLHKSLPSQLRHSDTVYIHDQIFGNVGMGSVHDFSGNIEKGNCAVKDMNGQWHTTIIRQKVSKQTDLLQGWGGRRYFLPGQKYCFMSGTDWIS